MSEELKNVDHMVLTVNQIVILLLNILAFTFNLRWLVAVVAVVMLSGTRFGVPGFMYLSLPFTSPRTGQSSYPAR